MAVSGAGLFLLSEANNRQAQEKQRLLARSQEAEQRKIAEDSTVEAKVRKALETNLKLSYILDIKYDEQTQTLTIVDKEQNPAGGLNTASPLTSTTYTELLRRGYSFFIHGGQVIFNQEGIEKLVFVQTVPFFENGLENNIESLGLVITKDKFQSVNWTSLVGKSVDKPLRSVTEVYNFNPKLKSELMQGAALIPN